MGRNQRHDQRSLGHGIRIVPPLGPKSILWTSNEPYFYVKSDPKLPAMAPRENTQFHRRVGQKIRPLQDVHDERPRLDAL